jgi:glycosyltransferase involved in cell wall biosynthesis
MDYKIQIQNNQYLPREGGIVTHAYNLAKEIFKSGYKIDILCRNNNGLLADYEKIENIPVMRHKILNVNDKLWLIEPNLEAAYLRKIMKIYLNGQDLIYSLHFLYAYASKKVSSDKKVVFVIPAITPREIGLNFLLPNLKAKIYKNILLSQYRNIERKAIETADRLVVLSRMRKKEISDYYKIDGHRLNVITPGIDITKFKNKARELRLLDELSIPHDAKVALTVCRLVAHKNLPMLIRAFSEIKTRNSYLVIVGNGGQLDLIKKLTKEVNQEEKIKIVGYQNNLGDYYSIADVFVLPSIYEGFGLVFLEAMACEIPCIGLRPDYPKVIVANDEIIKNGENGFLIDPYSEKDLAEKIDVILSDDKLRIKMGENARAICEKKYNWKEHTHKLLELGLNEQN